MPATRALSGAGPAHRPFGQLQQGSTGVSSTIQCTGPCTGTYLLLVKPQKLITASKSTYSGISFPFGGTLTPIAQAREKNLSKALAWGAGQLPWDYSPSEGLHAAAQITPSCQANLALGVMRLTDVGFQGFLRRVPTCLCAC